MTETIVEYAGFRYSASLNEDRTVSVIPLPGQHSAAGKDRHKRAARETYIREGARVYENADGYTVIIRGVTCPSFQSKGAARAYVDTCAAHGKIRA